MMKTRSLKSVFRRPQKPRKRPVDNLPVSCHEIFMKNINDGCKKSENGFFQIKVKFKNTKLFCKMIYSQPNG